ncbi:MAG: hypothetical protein QW717_06215 [Candidatus Bathyarchaeia archaeon]
MKRKYERYVSEIKYMPSSVVALTPDKKPFRESLIIDSTDLPTLTHHMGVFIIRRDGVRDGVRDVSVVPEDAAKLVSKRLRSGLPDEPPNELWPPLYRDEKGQVVSRGWPMYHTADEIFLFFGTDPDNPTDLGGEVEFWLGQGEDAEKYVFNKPTCIYVPAGLIHGPIVFRNVRRPFVEILCYTKPVLDEHPVFTLPKDYKP